MPEAETPPDFPNLSGKLPLYLALHTHELEGPELQIVAEAVIAAVPRAYDPYLYRIDHRVDSKSTLGE